MKRHNSVHERRHATNIRNNSSTISSIVEEIDTLSASIYMIIMESMSFPPYIDHIVINLKHRWPLIWERLNAATCNFDESVDLIFKTFPNERYLNCIKKITRVAR